MELTKADEKAAADYANAVFPECTYHDERFHARVAYKQGIFEERKRTEEIVEVMREALSSVWANGVCAGGLKDTVREALAKYEAWKAGEK